MKATYNEANPVNKSGIWIGLVFRRKQVDRPLTGSDGHIIYQEIMYWPSQPIRIERITGCVTKI